MLYQAELRSLPINSIKLAETRFNASPVFAFFKYSLTALLPPPTDPDEAGSPFDPLTGNPYGVRMRKRGPTAGGPNPLSLPGPATRYPGVGIFGSGCRRNGLLQRRRRSLIDHRRTGLLARTRRLPNIAGLLSAAGDQGQSGNYQNRGS